MAPQRTTTLDFIDSKSRPPQWPPRQPRRAPRGLEAAQRPRLASANAQSSTSPSLPTQFYYVSPSSASLPSLSESAPGSQKSQNWRLSPRLKATPQLPAGPCAAQPLVPSAQRSQAPGELGPGGKVASCGTTETGTLDTLPVRCRLPREMWSRSSRHAPSPWDLLHLLFSSLKALSVSASGGSTRSLASHRTSTACVVVPKAG